MQSDSKGLSKAPSRALDTYRAFKTASSVAYFDPIVSVRVDVGKGTHHHSKVTVEGLDAADRCWDVVIQVIAIAVLFDPWSR